MAKLVPFWKWMLLLMNTAAIIITDTVASKHNTNVRKRESDPFAKKVVCYYTNWSVYRPGTAKFTPQNINPYLCTHLIYAFVGLDNKQNGLKPYDKYQDIEQGGYAKFTGLKAYNKNLKTMIAIGGWNEGSTRFSPLVANEERRRKFVKNALKFLRQNNFDGLDLDWEYPAFRDGGKPEDRENYAALIQELREEFDKEASKTGKPRLLLTMAVPAGIDYIDKGYDIPKLNRYLDFMNILSYDYHSALEPAVNHHSPLYALQEDSEYNFEHQLSVDGTVKHYLKLGVDPEKLIVGIPTYGRSYTLLDAESTELGSSADGPGEKGEATKEKGYLAYYEICANLKKDDEWTVVQPKPTAMGPYAYKENQWVSYDDEEIVKRKALYVVEKGLGGIMYWSLDNDDFRGKCHKRPYALIEAGKEALFSEATTGNTADNTISPTKETKKPKQRRKHRPKASTASTTLSTSASTSTTIHPLSTPEPPTTPDPGADFKCQDEGFFAHPRDCKKYFWCLDSGPSDLGLVAHQFTCPSGLLFNKNADSCDYARNVVCNKKPAAAVTTTSTTTTTAAPEEVTTRKRTTTTTTTSTTTMKPEEIENEDQEEEYEDDTSAQEDPETIKQLINLIKKLGGVSELEKQLKVNSAVKEDSKSEISKDLYEKVFSSPAVNRFRSKYPNGRSGPQNEGIHTKDDDVTYQKEKPQYVTIQRNRPGKTSRLDDPEPSADSAKSKITRPSKIEEDENEEYVDDDTDEQEAVAKTSQTPKYASPPQSRSTSSSVTRSTTPRYVVIERSKPEKKAQEEEEEAELGEDDVEDEEENGKIEKMEVSPTPSTTHRYVTFSRYRSTTQPTTTGGTTQSTTTKSTIQPTAEPKTEPSTTTTGVTTGNEHVFKEISTESTKKILDSAGRFRNQFRRPGQSSRTRTSTITTVSPAGSTAQTANAGESRLNRFNRRRKLNQFTTSTESLLSKSPVQFEAVEGSELATRVNRARKTDIISSRSVSPPSHSSVTTYLEHSSTGNDKIDRTVADDAEIQRISYQPRLSSPDSDLANSAVIAIHHLKTVPPVPVPTTERLVYPFSSTNFWVSPTLPSTGTAAYSRKRVSHKRGSMRAHKITTTTASPYNQDAYSDYQDPDTEFRAEPIDIPISGKVRIHSDGYIECLDSGNFPHPYSCRKFISCAKMEYDSLLGWEYTCPKGLSFDPIGGICNWAAGLGCKE